MAKRGVAVTGYGIISPLGRGKDANVAALKAGKSGIVAKPEWAEKKLRSNVAGNVDAAAYRELFDRKANRFLSDAALLSAVAFQDAVAHAGLTDAEVQDPKTGIIIGSGSAASIPDSIELGRMLDERGGAKVGAYRVPLIMGSCITANIGSLFKIKGHSYSVTSACSTSAHAIMLGLDHIRSGRQTRVFAGGSEDINVWSASAFDGMAALSSQHNGQPEKASRPLDKGRDGFVFSGGAGVVVLEDLDAAKARGAKILAILAGAEATCDGDNMVAPNGIGAIAAMKGALADAGLPATAIDYINLHGTSTPVGDIKEVEAIKNVFGSKVPAFSSTKSMTGHGLGAAGSQEAIFSVMMITEGFLAPNINLDDPEDEVKDLPVVKTARNHRVAHAMSNSFGFGGTNCTLIFNHPETV